MIDHNEIDTTFIQSGNNCVMATYAIAGNYFTGTAISNYFEDYCKHFAITYSNNVDAEAKYENHFHNEYRKRSCLGYEIIKDLHENSKYNSFETNRNTFSLKLFVSTSTDINIIESALENEKAMLSFSNGKHSVLTFNSSNQLLCRDPNFSALYEIQSLLDISDIADSILLKLI